MRVFLSLILLLILSSVALAQNCTSAKVGAVEYVPQWGAPAVSYSVQPVYGAVPTYGYASTVVSGGSYGGGYGAAVVYGEPRRPLRRFFGWLAARPRLVAGYGSKGE